MDSYKQLLLQNRAWADEKTENDSSYFKMLSKDQQPEFLWIGCSDSRVPANEITGTEPGEMFVHRNIANMVVHTDLNLLSVLQYAVHVLKVKHVVVCGHYGCGGVNAAMTNKDFGLINEWLRNIKDVYKIHLDDLKNLKEGPEKLNKLCEYNVIEQVQNLLQTSVIQTAWKEYQAPTLHGWIFGMENGIINELITIKPGSNIDPIYKFDL